MYVDFVEAKISQNNALIVKLNKNWTNTLLTSSNSLMTVRSSQMIVEKILWPTRINVRDL